MQRLENTMTPYLWEHEDNLDYFLLSLQRMAEEIQREKKTTGGFFCTEKKEKKKNTFNADEYTKLSIFLSALKH